MTKNGLYFVCVFKIFVLVYTLSRIDYLLNTDLKMEIILLKNKYINILFIPKLCYRRMWYLPKFRVSIGLINIIQRWKIKCSLILGSFYFRFALILKKQYIDIYLLNSDRYKIIQEVKNWRPFVLSGDVFKFILFIVL